MAFSETAARDPVFYRWHSHIEDLAQEFRDSKMPPYREEDFTLSGDVREVKIGL